MNLQRLEGFYWVARTGGYACAAWVFPYPITALGVYQQVKRLEADLGVCLLERTGKDCLISTPAGVQLYELVASFLEKLPAVLQQIAGGELNGCVRVRASALVLWAVFPAWIACLEKVYLRLQVELEDIGQGDFSALQSGEVDVYIDHLFVVLSELDTVWIDTLRPFLVVPSRYRLARVRTPSLGALAGESFIAYAGDRRARELQFTALSLHGVTPARLIGASTADIILSLVAAGLGYSIVLALRGGPALAGVTVWPLFGPSAEFPVLATW